MAADELRIVRFLGAGRASCSQVASQERLVLRNSRGSITVSSVSLAAIARRGLLTKQGAFLALSESGVAFGRRHLEGAEDFQAQHREMTTRTLEVEGAKSTVMVNHRESPLATIARRRSRNGEPFLTADEFESGERLRSDYTRGQLLPAIGGSWRAPVASGRKSGERGGKAELTDTAIAARQRVERAIGSMEPELAGVLVDICCYLKGLDRVERERGWPARSAKVVLKTALGALSRHYFPERKKETARRSSLLHWGTEDYRPSLS